MLLLIDADKNSETGWYGYDFLVNKSIVDERTTTLKRYDTNSRSWIDQAEISYRFSGNNLELSLQRKFIGVTGDQFTFDFHWTDNPADLETPISLCINGDSAPNRRFNYRCIWKK